ncbi:MAG TPA: TIGR02281 family clan AA aspartic protease [Polaromonas sp.]|uniref:retropepsin-like aspartic protease family protein n=1 Tax=Polaromonas sp. TaxID=1869339 RepID=UPI002D63C57F|nr:TIGR02281 family clan AA aspartic protease [Polaromonas sp.]HYW58284.1 TIGR02281 family clan AA aspartic protease [Polaromonas sp.]
MPRSEKRENTTEKSGIPGLRWGPFGILLFWLVVMGLLYAAMRHTLKPPSQVVSVSGDLVIPRARDGHFYAQGQVHGKPITFLIDTGASLVVVSEEFAKDAGMAAGRPTTFNTANGELKGRIVPDITVSVGPASVSGARVGVGLVGPDPERGLLGQSFLSRFEILLSGDSMVLRTKVVRP